MITENNVAFFAEKSKRHENGMATLLQKLI